MKSFARLTLAVACICGTFSFVGCSSSEVTVVEPENEDQLEMMRQMVEAEAKATDESDANRPK
ncbi:hypothetical protein LOC67_24845 [Stieleria sp. JC731]|uniref:hypothetical protein n=1 Tax=Pirellulaceae TaxID=2691357 RepID=UPI001E3A63E3|nr:hypothetical protein [Stieleria sp. JC731]MCC9603792.1 hypothetical protein [Stieleria sp. JC731]